MLTVHQGKSKSLRTEMLHQSRKDLKLDLLIWLQQNHVDLPMINSMKTISRCILLVLLSPVYSTDHDFEGLGWNGWQPFAPRDEISPSFSVQKNHENNRKVALVIKHDSRENLYGGWEQNL